MAHKVIKLLEKFILTIVLVSILITFCVTPSAQAKLQLQEGEFYYAGTQKGQYTVSQGVFSWLLSKIGDIADWIFGIITLGFRMVMVGWTALMEKILTWALESASGMTVNGAYITSVDSKGNSYVNSTDLTAISDSSNNVTVESIVYNHVASLNANMFRFEKSFDDLKYTGTGRLLRCKDTNCNSLPTDNVTKCCGSESTDCLEDCKCGNSFEDKCPDCTTYMEKVTLYNQQKENHEADDGKSDPVIIKIKKTVAMWYYIFRTIAVVAMLIVLIVLGIKLAVSSIASDKALYKKMFFDWLTGIIIIFFIHYIMVFTFYVNESMVRIIERTAKEINKNNINMIQIAGNQKDETNRFNLRDQEIEIKVYETIRTRAYDAKLINGFTGMIMYMTLVFFAYKYTFMYLKRFFTIMILTLLAPFIGVSYALQKILTGKQASMKTWLSEYILNTIIQLVHALIYSIFISQALVLSMVSVPGIIIALILMNYSLKAEQTFRKIFKIQGLVDETSSAADNIVSTVKDTYVGGKAAVTVLASTPYTRAVKGIGKATLAAAGGVSTQVYRAIQNRHNSIPSDDDDSEPDGGSSSGGGSASGTGGSTSTGGARRESSTYKAKKADGTDIDKRSTEKLLNIGTEELASNVMYAKEDVYNSKNKEEFEENVKKLAIAEEENKRYLGESRPSMPKILLEHYKKTVGPASILSYTEYSSRGKGRDRLNLEGLNKRQKLSQIAAYTYKNRQDLAADIFGHRYRDNVTGKFVYDQFGYYNRFKAKNILGLTKDDLKVLKEMFGLTAGTITGMASIFLGFGTLIANPSYGLGMIAAGSSMHHKGMGKSTNVRHYKGKYTFSRFGVGTMSNLIKVTKRKVKEEYEDLIIENVEERSGVIKSLRNGTLTAKTIGDAINPVRLVREHVMKTKIGDKFYDLEDHIMIQQRKQEKEFGLLGLKIIKAEMLAQMVINKDKIESNRKYREIQNKIEDYKRIGYDYDPDTETATPIINTEEDQLRADVEQEINLKVNQSYDEEIVKEALKDDKKQSKKLSKYLEQEIDNILVSMSVGMLLDVNDEATFNRIYMMLDVNAHKAGVLKANENLFDMVIDNKSLKLVVQKKYDLAKERLQVATDILSGIADEDDRRLIQEAIKEIAAEDNISDFTKISIEAVIDRINEKRTSGVDDPVQAEDDNKAKKLTRKQKEFESRIDRALSYGYGISQKDKESIKKHIMEEARKRNIEILSVPLIDKMISSIVSDCDLNVYKLPELQESVKPQYSLFEESFKKLDVLSGEQSSVKREEYKNTLVEAALIATIEDVNGSIDEKHASIADEIVDHIKAMQLDENSKDIFWQMVEDNIKNMKDSKKSFSSEEVSSIFDRIARRKELTSDALWRKFSASKTEESHTSFDIESMFESDPHKLEDVKNVISNLGNTMQEDTDYVDETGNPKNELSKEQVDKYNPTVKKFLYALEASKGENNRKLAQVNEDAKRRKKKLDLIASLSLQGKYADATDDLYNQVVALGDSDGEIISKDGQKIKLSSRETASVLEMLFYHKTVKDEAENLNVMASDRLGESFGAHPYNMAVVERGTKRKEYYAAVRTIERFKLEEPELYNDSNYESMVEVYTTAQINAKRNVKQLESTLDKKKEEMENAVRLANQIGTVVDINADLRKILNVKKI